MLTVATAKPIPTVAMIERQVVQRLAGQLGSDPRELKRELQLAHRDLPVDVAQMRLIIGDLEQDFQIELACTDALEQRLGYVRDLALFIQRLMLAAYRPRMIVRRPSASPASCPTG